MPSNSKEYQEKNKEKYWTNPKAKAKRNARGRARYKLIKEWKVKVWDWKQVDHIKPLDKGGSNNRSNLRVVSAKTNWRGWAKIATANKKKK